MGGRREGGEGRRGKERRGEGGEGRGEGRGREGGGRGGGEGKNSIKGKQQNSYSTFSYCMSNPSTKSRCL